ncbi:SNF2 family N-terminal domain-containing protein [Chytriomyces sp. MP71]|nr:SNF2 family N-terminal domain-containing protein [Chytriomyces sp. MP71]
MDSLGSLLLAVQRMKAQGATEQNNAEYAKMVGVIRSMNLTPAQLQAASAGMMNAAAAGGANPVPVMTMVGMPGASGTGSGTGIGGGAAGVGVGVATTASGGQTPGMGPTFSAAQRETLRNQIQAFKMLSQNQSLSDSFKQSLWTGDTPSPAYSVDDDLDDPAAVPAGFEHTLDPLDLLLERERRINARIAHRIRVLESLPANLSNSSTEPLNSSQDSSVPASDDKLHHAQTLESSVKLRALIELKSLKLIQKQQALREAIYYGMVRGTTLLTSLDRNMYKRQRKVTLREARQTEQLEAERRGEREKREKACLQEYLTAILNNGRDILNNSRVNATKFQKLGMSVIKYHTFIEKEEQKRTQRVSQERLKALKENDEAAYIKLLDEAKDGRIMQILNKTNSYLANLASAVVTQKDHISSEDAILLDGATVIVPDEDDAASANVDYYAVAHRIKEKITKQSSLLVGGSLKEYQIKGLEWMISLYNNRLNGILADEMGLGKTIQTISLITYLIEHKKQNGPYLIIIPLATVSNWTHEFEKWAPGVTKLVFKGGPEERKRTSYQIKNGNFQVLITTFEYIIREKAILSKIKWVYMIIDEGHRMKNAQSKLSTTLMQYYQTRYRVILTGTPLQNNLPELWNLLNFVLPKIFNSSKSFDEWFSSPFAVGGAAQVELNEEERLLMIKGLHKVLRPFLLRRLKKDVEKELPDKVETIIKCPMSALQRKITDRVKILRNIGPFDSTKLSGSKALNNLVMQFRKICNHPFVFPEVEALVLPHFESGVTETSDMIWRVSGKFELLDRILPKYFKTGHRVLMFFQMTQIMDIVEDFFRLRNIKFLRLDGGVKGEDRESLLKIFNGQDSEYDIFILSTRAGGLGLNLQTADTVILFDSDWNPHQDLQAQDRAHRIGQKKEVRILRLITTSSIEEHILEKAQQKLDLDGKVIQAGKFDQKTSDKEREELLKVLFEKNEKGDKEDGEENEEMTDEQLNEVLARSPEEVEIFNQMDREREDRERALHRGNPPPRLIQEQELPDCYKVDFYSLKPEEADDLLSIRPRDRKQVRYGEVLSEEQWLQAVDSGTLDEAIKKKEEERSKRAAKKGADGAGPIEAFSDEEDDGAPDEPEFQEEDEEVKPRRITKAAYSATSGSLKKRGKKSKAEMLANDILAVDDRELLTSICKACVNAVREATDDSSSKLRYRSAVFEDLPSKRTYKDYYEMIQNPISIEQIQKKVNGMKYYKLQEFVSDFTLLFNNARIYNTEGSEVHEDANYLEATFRETFNSLAPAGGELGGVLKRKRVVDDDDDDEGGDGSVDQKFILGEDGEGSARRAKRVRNDSDDGNDE